MICHAHRQSAWSRPGGWDASGRARCLHASSLKVNSGPRPPGWSSVESPSTNGGRGGVRSRLVSGRNLVEDLERFADEGRDVRRLAGGHQIAVHHDLLVDDVRPGLFQVAQDRLPRGHAVVLVLVSAQQQLRPVADREHRLARLHERLHERHRLVVGPELVRAPPARDEQGIEILRLYILERLVDLRRDLALIALKLGPGLESDDGDRMTRLAERVVWLLELGILEFGPQHASNLHAIPPWKLVPEKPPYAGLSRAICG